MYNRSLNYFILLKLYIYIYIYDISLVMICNDSLQSLNYIISCIVAKVQFNLLYI